MSPFHVIALALIASLAHRGVAQTVIEPSQFDLGARCEPFSVANRNCQGVVPVGAMIYLNSTTTQSSADAFATSQDALISVVRNLDKPCADALYTWMCTIVFRPCLSLNYSASFAVPNFTCNSLCNNVNSICAATFVQYSQPPQICDPILAYNLTDYGGGVLEPTCSTGWASNVTSCPTQCLRPDFQDPERCCQLRCPLGPVLYGRGKWDSLVATLTVIGYIAVIATLCTVIIYSMNPAARKFPGIIIIIQGLALLMEGTGAIMTSWFGIDALHCSNDHYVACNTQTTFLAFGSQLALVYWTVVNVLTCLSLYVRYPVKDTMERYKWWLVLALISPILSVVLTVHGSLNEDGQPAGRTGPFYGSGITPVCFGGLTSIRNFYVIWMLVFVTVGTVVWFASIAQIIRLHITAIRKGMGGINIRGYLSIVLYQMFVFFTGGLYCLFFLLAYRHLGGHPSDLEKEILDYVSGATDVRPDGRYSLIYGQVFVISFASLFYAIIFGFHPINYGFIKSLYRKWRISRSQAASTTSGSSSHDKDLYAITASNGESTF